MFAAYAGLLAQTTITGTVTDESGEALIGVSILVKGTVLGTISEVDGSFELSVKSSPPLTLVISSVGYTRQELEITGANSNGLEVVMSESMLLGQEVVVSASRVEESILRSPVSIEKMDILAIQNTAADTYYKALANLKGVDVTTSSINFQIVNTRGFANTGNTRFVQLIDGMDTQAPALNFPIGNLNGPSELDVESVELLPGASSALYGPSAFNGVLLINSKNAFEYQGLSFFVKEGVNHINTDYVQPASPMHEFSLRYAKAFNNKFAFKVNASYMRANDWQGEDMFDRRTNPFESIGGVNPGADRLHLHGDEAGLNMNILRFSRNSPAAPGWETLASTGSGVYFDPTDGTSTAWQFAQNGFLPNHVISTPGYQEKRIVDYGAENLKLAGGLYYRINDDLELSYLYNSGFGTSIYTGAQRYSLSDFNIQQHRLQLRSDNFWVRAYTTRENSGGSYIAEFLTLKMNTQRYGVINNYFTEYPLWYLRHLHSEGFRPGDDPSGVTLEQQYAAHQFAQERMQERFPLEEGSDTFNDVKTTQLNGTIPDGPYFDDKSNMYHAEFQYDFKNQVDVIDLQMGASFRTFELNSNGTIFPDTTGSITISEFGGYAQAAKDVTDNLKLSGSIRFDKNQNFKGRFNPRLSAVYTIKDNHNLRVSYQTGFRNPTTQGQYISLDVISARLLGGLRSYYDFYNLASLSSSGQPTTFHGGSVVAFRDSVFTTGKDAFDPEMVANLRPFLEEDIKPVTPERIRSFEVGYRSLINNKLMVDFVYYYNIFNSFITQIQVNFAEEFTAAEADAANAEAGSNLYSEGDIKYNSLLNGSSDDTYQIYTNLTENVYTTGSSIGLTYSLPKGYRLGGNYSWNRFIGGYTANTLNDFNTPEHKFNVNFGNREVVDNLGFNITYRWQDGFRWESSFARGEVPAYSNLDAQVSYRLQNRKSIVKLGGSNILNQYYIQSLGGPHIGAIYYISWTFDQLMN
ncbi:MAG: TonB-dependent receptor [Cyclobacteriaceae bacterium]